MSPKIHHISVSLLLVMAKVSQSYHLVNISMNWSMAELYCQQQCNSNLASVHSQSQYDEIIEIVDTAFPDAIHPLGLGFRAWFGLNDIQNEMHFVYSDGTPFNFGNDTSKPGLFPWVSDSPANDSIKGNQDCADIIKWYNEFHNAFFSWNDDFCYATHPFICNHCDTISPTINPTIYPTLNPTVNPFPSPTLNPIPIPSSPSQALSRDYHYVNIALNWNMAEVYCQETCNSNLASIHSQSDFDEIAQLFEHHSEINTSVYQEVWFGLHDIHNELGFVFSDNTPFDWANDISKPGNYPWTRDSPANDSINGNQDCGTIIKYSDQDALWRPRLYFYNDNECYEYRPFICNQCSTAAPTKYHTTITSDKSDNPTTTPMASKYPSTAPTIVPSYTIAPVSTSSDSPVGFSNIMADDIFKWVILAMLITIAILMSLLIYCLSWVRRKKRRCAQQHVDTIVISAVPSNSFKSSMSYNNTDDVNNKDFMMGRPHSTDDDMYDDPGVPVHGVGIKNTSDKVRSDSDESIIRIPHHQNENRAKSKQLKSPSLKPVKPRYGEKSLTVEMMYRQSHLLKQVTTDAGLSTGGPNGETKTPDPPPLYQMDSI